MKSTNEYSCVLDAFAHISGVPAPELIFEIGHEGLELDGTPRGFHSQELIECLLNRGFSVTAIELDPVACNEITGTTARLQFREGNEERFARHLAGARGVVLGRNRKGRPHAIAWDKTQGLDATGLTFPLLEGIGEGTPTLRTDYWFTPHTFLRITR